MKMFALSKLELVVHSLLILWSQKLYSLGREAADAICQFTYKPVHLVHVVTSEYLCDVKNLRCVDEISCL